MIHYAEFRKIQVRYFDKGRGRVIVLLHGFLESLEVFEELSLRLSKNFRVIAIDLPGHGQTPILGYIHTMELMAQCVKGVMDSLHLKKYVVVGHSMGGYVALAFAGLFSPHVRGLCLFHSTAMPDSKERKNDRDRVINLVKTEHKKYVSELIPNFFAAENRSLLEKEVFKATQIAVNTSPEGTVAALLGMKERPSTELILKNISCPVLFIIGKKDVILAWENLLLLSSLPKRSSSIILYHAGHMGFYEAPQETFKAIRKFSRLRFSSKK